MVKVTNPYVQALFVFVCCLFHVSTVQDEMHFTYVSDKARVHGLNLMNASIVLPDNTGIIMPPTVFFVQDEGKNKT